MPEIRPFRALRFEPEAVGDLALVVSPAVRRDLARARSGRSWPATRGTCVRLDLPRDEPGEDPDERYRRAARTLAAWRSDGTLRKDPRPSIYVYEQTYAVPGHRASSGRSGASSAGSGSSRSAPGSGVLPHERTLAGPQGGPLPAAPRDRRQHVSPVVGLYDGPDGRAAPRCSPPSPAGRPIVEVTDDDGVRHRLWVVADDGDRTTRPWRV